VRHVGRRDEGTSRIRESDEHTRRTSGLRSAARALATGIRAHDRASCHGVPATSRRILSGGQPTERANIGVHSTTAATDPGSRILLHTHAIVLAGGNGVRFGGDTPKQFLRLAGEYILVRSVRAIAEAGVHAIVVVAHPERVDETEAMLTGAGVDVPVRVVAGGATRNESTWNGFTALAAAPEDVIVVHDAVRPLVPVEVIRGAIAPVASGAADSTDTVITSADTLVIVAGDTVESIPDRARYRRGQTPQVFRAEILEQAYTAAREAGDLAATDDCSLVLRYVPGVRMAAVWGDETNIKVTTPIDLVVADRLIQMRTIHSAVMPTASTSLEGERMLVVGGTNGIGQAIAERAEALGARVAVEGRTRGLDVRDADQVAERLDAAAARLGGLDHVVVTAAVLKIGSVAESSAADLAETVNVNVTGSLNVARAAYRHLAASRGSLTLFASSSFTRGRSGYVAYSATKAAVVNLSQGLADEWWDAGIRVNAVSPERTATPMRRRAFPDESTESMLSADEVAAVTLQLVASGLTGQIVDVKRNAHADPAPVPGDDTVAAPLADLIVHDHAPANGSGHHAATSDGDAGAARTSDEAHRTVPVTG
jgi:2-C-methyl-D-erythritol 4-phosphate cytidylyltransferase